MGRQLYGKDKRIFELEKQLVEDAELLKDCKQVILKADQDSKRLDWLESNKFIVWTDKYVWDNKNSNSLRQAIDKAMV